MISDFTDQQLLEELRRRKREKTVNGFSSTITLYAKKRFSLADALKIPISDLGLVCNTYFRDAWKEWVEARLQLYKKPTERALLKQMEKCARLGPRRAVEAIIYSIENGYMSIYEPRQPRFPTPEMSLADCLGRRNHQHLRL